MPQNVQLEDTRSAYTSSAAHLADKFRHLDLILRWQILDLTERKGHRRFNGRIVFRNLDVGATVDGRLNTMDDGAVESANTRHMRRLRLEIERLAARITDRESASRRAGRALRLQILTDRLRLSEFEEFCVCLCLAAEVDRKYTDVFGFLLIDATRNQPTPELVIELFTPQLTDRRAFRASFGPVCPLIRYRLLRFADTPSETVTARMSRGMAINENVADFLLGEGEPDAPSGVGANRIIEPEVPGSTPFIANRQTIAQLVGAINSHKAQQARVEGDLEPKVPALHLMLNGPSGTGKMAAARALASGAKLRLLVVDARTIAAAANPEDLTGTATRDALLHQAALCFQQIDSFLEGDRSKEGRLQRLVYSLCDFPRPVLLLSRVAWNPGPSATGVTWIPALLKPMNEIERERAWRRAVEAAGAVDFSVSPQKLAGKFPLTESQIAAAMKTAVDTARWRGEAKRAVTQIDIEIAADAEVDPGLPTLVRRSKPIRAWDELVLPGTSKSQLDEICVRVEYSYQVFGKMGFGERLSYGKGTTALFTGPPGTGKTMAAEIIAARLNVSLYKVDLSQVVSKYIGETEKNLREVFRVRGVLFFDEAECLFSTRSEVSDAHDRYANMEVAFLLQQMEEYDGIAILATNLRQNMDDAFMRRLQFVVEFPFPEEAQRREIWSRIFPAEVPGAKSLPFDVLARNIKLAGGGIKNIALAASFLAAAKTSDVTLDFIYQATEREYRKQGRAWTPPALDAPIHDALVGNGPVGSTVRRDRTAALAPV